MRTVLLTLVTLAAGISAGAQTVLPYKDASLPVETRVADLLGRMTLREKAGQLLCPMGWEMYEKGNDGSISLSEKFIRQNRGDMPVGAYWAVLRADSWTQKTLATGLSPRQSAEALNAMQRFAVDSTRLGIPILFAEELPHGHFAIGTTVLPTGIGMASTWNRDLIRAAGKAAGNEAALQGASIGYGPVLDIARDARWSRMEETFGEDPYLTGELGTAYMLGIQSADAVPGRRIFSTLKHFAAYGVPESGHNGGEAAVGPVRLISELLPPFKKAVTAGAGSIMTSYNTIDGVPCTGNRFLLTDLLRHRWGFNGFVVSDLFSIDGMVSRVAADRPHAGAIALHAGVDMDLGASAYGERAVEAFERGLVGMEEIDSAVSRILRAKFLAGLFENPFVDPDKAASGVHTAAHRALALEVARQSVTLLTNDGILPFTDKIKRIAVIGPNADMQYNQLGDYTAPQRPDDITTVLEGIRGCAPKGTEIFYVKGCAIRDTTQTDIAAAVAAAESSDAVVLVVGGSSARDFRTRYIATGAADTGEATRQTVPDMDCGEGFDRATLGLLGDQIPLMQALIATGKPVVVIYIQGRPLDMNYAAAHSAALLTAWYPGAEGGTAIAEVLFGQCNPSGRLPVSVPRSVGQVPVYYSQPGRRDYMDVAGTPLFAFGHGLSYTTFAYSDLAISKPDAHSDTIVQISCKITNTGSRPGAEVAQLYVRDVLASVAQPPMLLKGFARVELAPGESTVVAFPLTAEDLSIYTPDLKQVLEPGEFKVMIGPASDNIHLTDNFTIDSL